MSASCRNKHYLQFPDALKPYQSQRKLIKADPHYLKAPSILYIWVTKAQ